MSLPFSPPHPTNQQMKSNFTKLATVTLALLSFVLSGRAQAPSLTASLADPGRISLSWPQTAEPFALEQSSRLGAGATWSAVGVAPVVSNGKNVVLVTATGAEQYFRLRGSLAQTVTPVSSTSPANGASGVSVNRETILDFAQPLASDTIIGADTFYAEAAGRRILSRPELTVDRRTAKLFYLEPVPAGTRVTVRFNGDNVRDARGQAVDADGDGKPGGVAIITFDTANTAALKGTAVTGHVYASDPVVTGAGFVNRPLAGVLITVDGAEDRLRAETDENGFFSLTPCPPGRFFVHIDGRPALGSDWPNGDYYPFVGKTFEAVAGRTNNRAGGTGEIFLPLIKAGTLQTVNATQPTTVTIPPEVVALNPALAGVSITVPANALFADDGTRGGKVGLAPVAPDRIPSPLPPGLDFPIVITVQTDGPSNFDQPVPVRFPNLPDPKTGVKLAPGAKSALWSFNHDTGQWEIQGSMTVTADGNFVETDPGVGIRQPGWHSSTPGSTGGGGGGGGGPCDAEQQALEDAILGCAIGAALELAELAPAIGCGISLASAAASSISDCSDPAQSCAGAIAYNGLFGVAGCIPGVGTFAGALQCAIELGAAIGDLAACQSINNPPSSLASFKARLQGVRHAADDALVLQDRLSNASRALVLSIYGDAVWMEAAARDVANIVVFGNSLVAALDPAGESAARISAAERSALLALPAPNGLALAVRTALLDRFDRFAQGGMTAGERGAITEAANALTAATTDAQNAGWTTMIDGLKQGWTEVTNNADEGIRASGAGGGESGASGGGLGSVDDVPIAGALAVGKNAAPSASRYGPIHTGALLFRVVDQVTGFVRRGRSAINGQVDQLITAVDREYIMTYLDPATLEVGSVFFKSGAAGGRFRLPLAALTQVDGPDADQDGLTDLMEDIVGTSPSNRDTDNDGTPDLVEVQQGLNPLDGLALPVGIVANLPLNESATGFSNNARALGLHADGSRVFVANGKRGLAIVDATDPLQPTRQGELDLLGESYDVTYSPDHQVAGLVGSPENFVGGERGLLQFVDVSNPNAPRLKQSYSLPTVAIDAWNGLFYVALGQFALKEVRMFDPGSAIEVGSFTTQDFPTGLRVVGGRAYVATASGLEILDARLGSLTRLGRLAGDFTPETLGRVHLVLDGTTLYVAKTRGVATIDVSVPAAPRFIGVPPTTTGAVRSLALNGGRRMVALVSGLPTGNPQAASALSVFDASDPANTTTLFFGLGTPGRARDVAMLRGFAAVADDVAGLTILNFADADLNGQPPVITFDPATLDVEAAKPGLQVTEGFTLELAPRVQDDVHLARVELLVDGQVVQTQRNYPVNFRYNLPTLGGAGANPRIARQGVGAANIVTLQFRAVDRSGNAALGNPITLELVRDPQPPTLVTSLPAQNGAAFVGEPFVFEFSEAVDSTPVDASKVHLLNLGADAAPGGGDDSEATLTSSSIHGASVNLIFPAQLAAGKYQLTLQAGAVKDRVGNALALDSVFTFILVNGHPGTGVWISDADGQFDDPTKWLHGRVPTQDSDVILQRFGAKPVVTLDSGAIVKNITIGTPFTAVDRGSLYVLGNATASERVDVPAGTLIFNGSALFEKPLAIAGGRVEAAGRLEAKDQVALSQGGSLTMDGPSAQVVIGGAVEAVNCTFSARNGAIVELPTFVTFDSPGDFTPLFPVGAAFSSQGVGSRLTLPNLTSANGPVDWNFRGAPALRFEAVSGGELSLPKLTSLTGRTILSADGFGSVLDARMLDRITGPDSDFESAINVSSFSKLQVPLLTVLEHCNMTLEADSILAGGSLELAETSSLKGAGTVAANVLNRGAILLNRVPGNLVIDGRLDLASTSVIAPSLGLGAAQDEAGRIEVRGDAVLNGTLQIALGRGYTPQAGEQFEVALFAKPPTGAISQVDDSALGASLKAELESLPNKWNVKIITRP